MKGDRFGNITMELSGYVIGIKLNHTSGNLSCLSGRKITKLGCGDSHIFVAITDSHNNLIYPNNATGEWQVMSSDSARSPVIILNDHQKELLSMQVTH